MLKLELVNAYYGLSHVLHDVSLQVNKGELICLLGRNGVGKTTTVKTIMGVLPPRRGRIFFEGIDITALKPFQIARLGIGYVPQGRRIFPNLTVAENLLLGAIHINSNHIKDRLEEIHQYFPDLKKKMNQPARTLSGGQLQMLAIARALIGNNKLLILDEPSEGLSPMLLREIAKILSELKNYGKTIFLVEQNVKMALAIADRAYIMEKGRIFFEGTPQNIMQSQEAMDRLGL
ncbi:MAG: ABC transporter ATP-binding protein [Candidatus Caldarchaeum sp.]